MGRQFNPKSKLSTLIWNTRRTQLVWILLLCLGSQQSSCAPTIEDEEQGGCYYMFNHYGEGDRILTNEPCLNCTCHNSMLMCYLRVCPFTKPIGQDCTIEKKADQCCPVITCPEVPVSLLTSMQPISTTSTTPSSALVVGSIQSQRGCEIEDRYYSDGAQVDLDFKNPCELCYCIRNRTACVMQECILHVEGCEPEFEYGVCCPVRYKCQVSLGLETTTIAGLLASTISSLLTSTPTPHPGGCYRDGEFYYDGSQIPTPGEAPCEHCYCMRGEIVCAVQECGSPLEGAGQNCTAIPPRTGVCCPEQYSCHPSRQDRQFFMSFNDTPPSNISSSMSSIMSAVVGIETTPASATELSPQLPTQSIEILNDTVGVQEVPVTTTRYEEDLSGTSPDTLAEGSTQIPVKGLTEGPLVSFEPSANQSTQALPTVEPVASQSDDTVAEISTQHTLDYLPESTTHIERPAELQETVSSSKPVSIEITTKSTLVSQSTEPAASYTVLSPDATESGTPAGFFETTIDQNQASTESVPETVEPQYPTSSPVENELFSPESEQDSKMNTSNRVQQLDVSKINFTASTESATEITSSESSGITAEAVTQVATSTEIPSAPSNLTSATESILNANVTEIENLLSTQSIVISNKESSVDMVTSSYTETEAPTGYPEQPSVSSTVGPGADNIQEVHTDKPSATDKTAQSEEQDQTTQPIQTSTEESEPIVQTEQALSDDQIGQNTVSSVDDLKYSPSTEALNLVESTSKSTFSTGFVTEDRIQELGPGSPENLERITSTGSPTQAEIINTTETLNQDSELQPAGGVTEPGSLTEPVTSKVTESQSVSQESDFVERTTPSVFPTQPAQAPSQASVSSSEETSVETTATEISNGGIKISESSAMADDSNESLQETTKSYVELPTIQAQDRAPGLTSTSTAKSTEAHTAQDLEISKPTETLTEEVKPTVVPDIENLAETSTVKESTEEYPAATSEGPPGVSASLTHISGTQGLPEVSPITESTSHHPDLGSVTTPEALIQGVTNEAQVGVVESSSPVNIIDALGTERPVSQETGEPVVSTNVVEPSTESSVAEIAEVSKVPEKTPESTEEAPAMDDLEPFYSTEFPKASSSLAESTELSTQGIKAVSETSQSSAAESVTPSKELEIKESPTTEELSVTPAITTEAAVDQTSVPADKITKPPVIAPIDSTESSSTETASEYSETSPITQSQLESASSAAPSQAAVTEAPSPITESVESTSHKDQPQNLEQVTAGEQATGSSTETSDQISANEIGDIEKRNFTSDVSSTKPPQDYTQTSTTELGEYPTTPEIIISKGSEQTESPSMIPENLVSAPKPSSVSPESGLESSSSSVHVESILPSTTPISIVETTSEVGTSPEAELGSTSAQEFTRIPGEGSCFVDGVTYPNGSRIPPSTSCQIACACQNSIVHCLLVHCPAAPRGFGECKPVYTQNKCCPKYNCDDFTDASITVTPESTQPASPESIVLAEMTATPTQNQSSVPKVDTSVTEKSTQLTSVIAESEVNTTAESITLKPKQDSTQGPDSNVSSSDSSPEYNKTETTFPSKGEEALASTVHPTFPSHTLNHTSATESTPKMNTTLKYPVTFTPSSTTASPSPTLSSSAPSNGACLFDSRVYMSAQQIPRDDPCDFCFCFRGDIICLQQSCPPPIPGCYEEPIPGFCCPRYECPVGTGNTTTATLLPPSYYHNQGLNNAAQPSSAPSSLAGSGAGCEIQGEYYEAGQIVTATSGPCLECRCGQGGIMECDPRECQPEPMLRKMIESITSR